jgi:Protein of unknown function (DUF3309)
VCDTALTAAGGRHLLNAQIHPPQILESAMSLVTIVLIVLLLMLVGVLPTWPHSKSWGYGPSGGVGLIVVILIVLLLMGRV